MYGCDFILEAIEEHECGCQPKLLEITFDPADLAMSDDMPEQYPDFANECFGCLYLGDLINVTRLHPHPLERVTATDVRRCSPRSTACDHLCGEQNGAPSEV